MNVQTELEQVKEELKIKRQALKETQENIDALDRWSFDEIKETGGGWRKDYDGQWSARHDLKAEIRHLQKRQTQLNKLK